MSLPNYYDQTIKVITVTAPDQFSTADFTESCATEVAAVNPVNGVESFSGGQNHVFADYKVFMSATAAITETNRVRWNSKELNVVFVKNTLARGHHKLVFLKTDAAAV